MNGDYIETWIFEVQYLQFCQSRVGLNPLCRLGDKTVLENCRSLKI